jgi:hypothetical protein
MWPKGVGTRAQLMCWRCMPQHRYAGAGRASRAMALFIASSLYELYHFKQRQEDELLEDSLCWQMRSWSSCVCLAGLAGGPHWCVRCLQVWFTSTRDYISFSSPPLQLHDDMINMHGGFAGTMGPPRRTSSQEQMQPAAGAAGGSNGFAPGGFSSYPGSTVEGWAPPADWEAAGPQGGAAGGGEREREREGGSSRGGRGGRGGSRAGSAGSSYKRGADSDDEYDPDNDSFSGSSPGSSEVDSDDSSRPRRSARGGGRGGRGRGRGRLGGGGGGGGGALSLRDISRKVLEKR